MSISQRTKFNFVLTKEELKNDSPSQQKGLSAVEERKIREFCCEYIHKAGILLKQRQVVMATAQVLFHRYYWRTALTTGSPKMVSLACLFIAGKSELAEYYEVLFRIRDIAQVYHRLEFRLINKNKKNIPKALDYGSADYQDFKEQLLQNERSVLVTLGFTLHVDLPHKFLFHYLQILELAEDHRVAQESWNFVNDSLRLDVSVRYKPEAIATAAIYSAAKKFSIYLPETDPAWYQLFEVSLEEINQINQSLINLYQDNKHLSLQLQILKEKKQQRKILRKEKKEKLLQEKQDIQEPNLQQNNDLQKVEENIIQENLTVDMEVDSSSDDDSSEDQDTIQDQNHLIETESNNNNSQMYKKNSENDNQINESLLDRNSVNTLINNIVLQNKQRKQLERTNSLIPKINNPSNIPHTINNSNNSNSNNSQSSNLPSKKKIVTLDTNRFSKNHSKNNNSRNGSGSHSHKSKYSSSQRSDPYYTNKSSKYSSNRYSSSSSSSSRNSSRDFPRDFSRDSSKNRNNNNNSHSKKKYDNSKNNSFRDDPSSYEVTLSSNISEVSASSLVPSPLSADSPGFPEPSKKSLSVSPSGKTNDSAPKAPDQKASDNSISLEQKISPPKIETKYSYYAREPKTVDPDTSKIDNLQKSDLEKRLDSSLGSTNHKFPKQDSLKQHRTAPY